MSIARIENIYLRRIILVITIPLGVIVGIAIGGTLGASHYVSDILGAASRAWRAR